MYKRQKKIPTILGLLLLFSMMGGLALFDRNLRSLSTSAKAQNAPKNVQFANMASSSFNLSFLTEEIVSSSIEVSGPGGKKILMDDLDSDNIPRGRKNHSFSLNGLQENTRYEIRVITEGCGNKCSVFTQKTTGILEDSLDLPAVKGTITDAYDRAVAGALVYIMSRNTLPLSARTDSAGIWAIPLGNLVSSDYRTRPGLSGKDLLQINVYASLEDKAEAVIDIDTIRRVSPNLPMKLGKSYNFIDLLSKKDWLAKIQSNILGTDTRTKTPEKAVPMETAKQTDDALSFPRIEGDATPDNKPRFYGTAKPGSQLLITINSAPQIGKITVNKDGTWSWRPPKGLEPGQHHISIEAYDSSGKLVSVRRSFYVLKSGERVLGDSTPSASLTPSLSPSPTTVPSPSALPNLTVSPSPTASNAASPTPTATITLKPTNTIAPSPTSPPVTPVPPRTGSISPTYLLLGLGVPLFIAGMKLLLF